MEYEDEIRELWSHEEPYALQQWNGNHQPKEKLSGELQDRVDHIRALMAKNKLARLLAGNSSQPS